MQIFELFFYLTILLLPTQLGLHFWPDFTLVLGRRVDYLSPTLYLTDITILLTLVAWFVQKNAIRDVVPYLKRYKYYGLAMFLCIAINYITSTNQGITLFKWAKSIEYLLFFYYIYVSKPSMKKTVYCIAIAICYSCCIAITQFLWQHTIGGLFWFLGERAFDTNTAGIAKVHWCGVSGTTCIELLRPYATFPHPNILGGFLGTTIPLLIATQQKEPNKYIRLLLMTGSILGILTLGLTFSRSAWIIGGFFICWACIRTGKTSFFTKGLGILAVAAAAVLSWPYLSVLNKGNESVFIRLDLAEAALMMIRQHPLFGTGLGTFLHTLPQVVQVRDLFFLQPVHNIYLLFISETGSIGIFLFAISAYLYKKAIKRTQLIVLLPLISLALLGLVDHYPTTVQQGQLLTTIFFAFPFFKTNS